MTDLENIALVLVDCKIRSDEGDVVAETGTVMVDVVAAV